MYSHIDFKRNNKAEEGHMGIHFHPFSSQSHMRLDTSHAKIELHALLSDIRLISRNATPCHIPTGKFCQISAEDSFTQDKCYYGYMMYITGYKFPKRIFKS